MGILLTRPPNFNALSTATLVAVGQHYTGTG
jgi:hypothetical protein